MQGLPTRWLALAGARRRRHLPRLAQPPPLARLQLPQRHSTCCNSLHTGPAGRAPAPARCQRAWAGTAASSAASAASSRAARMVGVSDGAKRCPMAGAWLFEAGAPAVPRCHPAAGGARGSPLLPPLPPNNCRCQPISRSGLSYIRLSHWSHKPSLLACVPPAGMRPAGTGPAASLAPILPLLLLLLLPLRGAARQTGLQLLDHRCRHIVLPGGSCRLVLRLHCEGAGAWEGAGVAVESGSADMGASAPHNQSFTLCDFKPVGGSSTTVPLHSHRPAHMLSAPVPAITASVCCTRRCR